MTQRNAIQKATKHYVKYSRKTSLSNISAMENRFNPDFNFSQLSFAFNLQLALNINIDIKIIFNPQQKKAKYGTARYDIDYFDPLTLLGTIAPDEITKFLLVHLVHEFLNRTDRGYKYAFPTAAFFLNSEIDILAQFAPKSIWNIRVRKMEAARNWTSFLGLMFLGVNILQLDPYHDERDSELGFAIIGSMILGFAKKYASEALIRFSDVLKSVLGFMVLGDGYLNNIPFIQSLAPRTFRDDNLTSNLVGHGVIGRMPVSGEQFPFAEVYLMFPSNTSYEPVIGCMNLGYDVLETPVEFNPDVLVDLMGKFNQTQNVIFQQWQQMSKVSKMQTDYAIHQTFQQGIYAKVIALLGDQIVSPVQIPHYVAFALEYPYKKKFNQLVNGELVIQKYKKQGLDETLLRRIAAMTLR